MLDFLKKKTQVILDTNFLLMPGEHGVDIFSEMKRILSEPYELCILDKTEQELKKIVDKERQKKSGFNAKLGYIMIKQKGLKTIQSSSPEYADEAIIKYASKNPGKTIVATQDKELREKLGKIPVRTVVLRQKRYLELR